MKKALHKALAVIIFPILVLANRPARSAEAAPLLAFPGGFTSESVVTNLTGPTTIAFAPDGRMFIGQKDGRVRVFENGVLLPTDFINISPDVNNNWDRGLLGIAIHPDFPNTPYVYLLYTYDPPGVSADGGGARVARLLRVSADPNNTNVALPGSGVILLGTNSTFANIGNPNNNTGPASCQSGTVFVQDCIAADSPSHTIGTLAFGTDGSLFVSSGDGAHFNFTDARALRSLNVDSLNGKILRINPLTGGGYSDNPFYNGNPNSNRSKVYSLGLRNPFRITINTLTNEPFIGDVGWNTWEEINTGRGENFGWPCYEGNNTGSAVQGSYASNSGTAATCSALYLQGAGAVQAPVYAYNHSSGSSSVQAGAFYRGTVYPPQYQGALFFSDYNGDWIRYLTFDAGGNATNNNFATDVSPVGGIVQLLAGPDTNLYYVAYNGPTPNTSEVRRIRYTAGGNTPPTANASADPTSGIVPLDVNFSSQGTFDPDAQPLTYLWNFGDGNTSPDPDPTHTYLDFGTFTVTLTVTDPLGATGTDTVTITIGNLAPVATILTPADGLPYNTDDTINYSGTGVDNEDGNLSGASLQWDILLHHNAHTHFDFIPGMIGNTGSFDTPDHGDNTWIELCLTVTDSGGLNDQECVDLQPNTVTLNFDTVPSGLSLEYDGVTYMTPFSVATNVNAVRDLIAAPTQQCHNFVSWSDGGAASHQITIPSTSQTYVATYTLCPITIAVDPGQSKTYGNPNPTYAFASSIPSVPLSGSLARAPGETVGSYAINQGTLASADSRYVITTFIGANFTINTRVASVTPNALGKIYGNIDPTLTGTLSGFLPADNVTASYGRTPGETVAGGPYVISAILNPSGVLANYNITYNTANFTISQRNVSVTPNAVAKIYGNADPLLTGTLTGFLPADNVTALYSRTAGETVAGSPYVIGATLNPSGVLGNYNITFNTANFTISPRNALVTPNAAGKTYGDSDPALAGVLGGFIPSDNVIATYSRVPGESVAGSPYTISAVLTPSSVLGNYNITYNTANFTIIPLDAAVVIPNAASKIYGNPDPAFTGTLIGFLPSDNVTATYSRTPGETVAGNPYTISATLSPANVLGNYNISYNTTNFTINARSSSVTPNPAVKTYGDSDPALSGTLSGFLPADNVTAAYNRASGETVTGSPYPISATLSPSGVLGNYNITYNTAGFTINARNASVTPNPASKAFGDVDPPLSGTLSGFLPADAVTASYTRTPGETVAGSPYLISAALSPAGVLGNYNITYNTANFTISGAGAAITLGNLNHTYDGTPKSASITTTPNGLPVNITYNGSATSPTDAGSYSVSATITDTNYSGTANGTLVIDPAIVDPVITADDKPYDGSTVATIATRNLNGVIGSDDVSLMGGTASFANANVGTWTVTATGLTLSGADSDNYQLSTTTATTTASITQGTVNLSTVIHNAGHVLVTSAIPGVNVHHSAVVSGAGATPSGTVTFTAYANPSCSGPASDVGSASLDAGGAADPGVSSVVNAAGLSFRATYNGNFNYASQTGLCDSLNVAPAFTSADIAAFTVGSAGSFSITTIGLPDVSSVTSSGALPAGVTFIDNGDGTATLSGTPAASTQGVYNLVLTAVNGIAPDAVQSFTLTVEQAAPPTIPSLSGINTNIPTSDNVLSEFEVVGIVVTEFTVTFDQDVLDIGGTDPDYDDSVTNPANYMLVRDNGTGFETASCEDGVAGDDTAISIDSVAYDNNEGAGPFIATLGVNLGLPLPNGTYRLYVCGTTSIVNLFGVELAGDGTAAGTDFVRNFTVNIPTGGNGGGNNLGNNNNQASFASQLIPVTGFAPGMVTALPDQPASLVYIPTAGMILEIPSIDVKISIVGVPQINNSWDLKWLGNKAGYLEGSAYPTWRGNTVLTAHVLDSTNKPGPFANIRQLKENELVYIHAGGLTYVYQIKENKVVSPNGINDVFRHEEYDWLTLLTCENYYAPAKTYLSRRVLHAVLISVIPEQ